MVASAASSRSTDPEILRVPPGISRTRRVLVVDIDGDASIRMNLGELETVTTYDLPVKVLVMNNFGDGMVKQWQSLFYQGRISASHMPASPPDYPKLAEAMGCVGLRVTHPDEVDVTIEKSLAIEDRPVAIEVVCDPDEMCFPMVPAGGSNDQIAMGPEDL